MDILLVRCEREGHDLSMALARSGFAVTEAFLSQNIGQIVASSHFDAAIITTSPPDPIFAVIQRGIEKNGGVSTIALTTDHSAEQRIAALNEGASDSLSRPYDLAELIARLNVISRKGVNKPTKLNIRDLELDVITRGVWRNRVPIRLLPKEFLLLEALVRNVGRIVSKKQLLQAVSKTDHHVRTNFVETQLCRLRAKLAKSGSLDLIETVRGKGYRIRSASNS